MKTGITAALGDVSGVRLFTPGVTASVASRTLAGPVVRYGVPGRTSRGMLRVRPGALYVLGDLSGVKLTKEHLRGESRGHAAAIDFLPDGIRAAMRVSDGPEGDAALREAQDHTRDGFSFDVIDEVIEGDEIVSGRIIAIGQVGIPAYDDMRIDTIAASMHTNEGASMTPEQRARLAELLANQNRTPDEEAEFQQLAGLAIQEATAVQAAVEPDAPVEPTAPAAPAAAAPQAPAVQPAAPTPVPAAQPAGVAASVPAIPGGQPMNQVRPGVQVRDRSGNAFQTMIRGLADAFALKRRGGDPMPGITAALNDVISTGITTDIEPLAWSGELFSGVDYQPLFSDLLQPGELTNWKGEGWRFTATPDMADYAGDKAAIPSGTVGTEESLWEAARAAVGVDIDRKFFDFPNESFLTGLFQAMAQSWLMVLDTKSRLFMSAEAVKATKQVAVSTTNADATVTAAAGTFSASDVGASISGTGIPVGATIITFTNSGSVEISANATATGAITATMDVQAPTVLKAAARASMSLNKRSGQSKAPSATGADWIVLNEEDHFTLLDVTAQSVPEFLKLYGIAPENLRSSPDVPQGEVWAGVRRAATLRTEGRSPIAVDALNLANGGVDKAFFGYWAIEQHHLRGIQKTKIVPV
jgi:hypothetical protein